MRYHRLQSEAEALPIAMTEFDRYASSYKSVLDRSVAIGGESSDYFIAYKAAWIVRFLGAAAPRRILDFGCGVGLLTSALARLRPDDVLHGYDVSDDSLRQVEPALRERGVFTTSLADLGSDFDLIVVANVLHHVSPATRQATIDDLASRLARGGSLLVIEHNPLNPLTRWVVAHCEFDDDAILLGPSEVRRHFVAAGLTAPRRDYIVFFPRALSRLRGIERLLAWCPLGAQYAAVATAAA